MSEEPIIAQLSRFVEGTGLPSILQKGAGRVSSNAFAGPTDASGSSSVQG